MRKVLEHFYGRQISIIGTFNNYGKYKENGVIKNAVAIVDISLKGRRNIIVNHLWFKLNRAWNNIELTKGCIVEITGVVIRYKKGDSYDYAINFIKSVKVIKKSNIYGAVIAPCSIWNEHCKKYFKYITAEGPKFFEVCNGYVKQYIYKDNDKTYLNLKIPNRILKSIRKYAF